MQDVANFGAIQQQMKAGGAEALLDHLLKVDLRDVNLRKIPNTAARREQQLRSMEPMVAFWFERLNNGSQLQTEDHWLTEVVKGELFREYTGGAQRAGEYRRGGETQLGILLRKMCPGVRDSRLERMHNAQKRRMAVYLFPTLEQCRREFEQYAGQSFDWNVATGAVRVPSDTADYVVPL
jgi:hypothetical protein